MANPYRGGTPDDYYEGANGVLWVEWKFLPALPPIIDLTYDKAKVKLSPLQRHWLRRAHGNGVNTAVIAGCKDGGVIFHGLEWERQWDRELFQSMTLPRKAVARWIEEQVL